MKPDAPGSRTSREGLLQTAKPSLRGLVRPGVVWVVLGLCLLGTAVGCLISLSQLHDRGEDRFELHINRVRYAMQSRMTGYEQVLKGAAGLFAASKSVERAEWRDYVQSLDIEQRYKGIRALGFIARVPASERESFLATNRLDGAADFTIWPTDTDPESWVVKYVEPRGANLNALGYNLATEERRAEAARATRDSGQASLTRRIKLVQSVDDDAAVLLLLPIYRNGAPIGTEEERRANLEGWVYAAFIMEDLMEGLIESQDPEIDFEIFDDNQIGQATLLYNTDVNLHALNPTRCSFQQDETVDVVDRNWLVHFNTRPAFDAATDYTETYFLVFGGLCISFLLVAITLSLTSTRQHALTLARQMTEKFRIQERAVISSNNGIFITDASQPHNPILYANPAMEKMTGYTADEMAGRTPGFLIGDDTDQPDLRSLQSAMNEGRECRVALRCSRHDRTLFWSELSISPVRDEAGIVNHFVGIIEDISERKQAEETLRATSALQRAILDSAGYAVISASPDGLIRVFNAAAERMTGYKTAEVLGKPTSLLIHDWTEVERRARELSKELGRPVSPDFEVFVAKARLGQADEHEWTYHRKDGSELPVLLSVTPVRDERGVILGFMGIASDITERKRAEAQLHQATVAAESANRAKSEFLANMSHEIRTPMNAVIGMTELALTTELTREQRGYLTAAKNSATDLLTIINDVLDFSKIEAGKLELHPEQFYVRDAVSLGLKAFSLRAAEKGIELTLRVDPDVPEMLSGDVGRLRQILNNLVGNALKFTQEGEVSVNIAVAGTDTERLTRAKKDGRVGMPTRKRLIHFSVADTGIGIPEEKQKAIFDAFTQGDASVTRRFGGTGLGLAISNKLCRLMGGEIWVTSQPGQGSHFHFTAVFDSPPQPATTADPTSLGLDGQEVLVVDDNDTNRGILCEMLSNWRMIPIPAASAGEALTKIQNRESAKAECSPRFAIIDVGMPGTDGVELARSIWRLCQPPPEVVMMLSSAGSLQEMKRCREAGIETFLVKPVGQSELLNVILHRVGASADQAANGWIPQLDPKESGGSLRVLLAEDNPVNRDVATTVLRKLGHTVMTVSNGQEAIDAWAKGEVDLILMDVQMPAMDGMEATAHIRQREKGTKNHIPIIGLTAHAMKGDREHGLSVGMDEYVTKPLQMEELSDAIRRWTPRREASHGVVGNFDYAKLLHSLNGDKGALRRLVSIFLESTPPLLGKLHHAVTSGDAAGLLHAAHTLRGSLAHLGEEGSRSAANNLEQLARKGSLEGADRLVAELERNLIPFEKALRRWIESGA